jgi:hypothetical protein
MEGFLMSIIRIKNGLVAQRWEDVNTLSEFTNKYGLSGSDYVEAEAVVGQVDQGGGIFSEPPPPTQVEIDAELEAQVQSNTDDILQNDKRFRVMAELIFDTLKAGNTGDYSAFNGVTNPSTFRDHVIARFRALG